MPRFPGGDVGPPSWASTSFGPPGWAGGRRFARRMFLLFALFLLFPILLAVVIAGGVAGWTGAAVAVVVLAVLAVAGVMLVRFGFRTVRSVNDLVSSTGRLSEGDYSVRMVASDSAAFRPATDAFNRMAERLEQSDDLRRRLLADVGHELRTPLTIIRGELEAMADGVRTADEDELRRLLDDLAAMERLLDDLTTLSTTEAGVLDLHLETTDVGALVADVAGRFRSEAEAREVALVVSPDGAGDVATIADVDPHRVGQVVANLLANALRAVSAGGRIDVGVARARVGDRPAVVIEVADDGAGIPPDQLDAVFDRFHKGDESTGSGLGLTISRRLVDAHGGTLRAASGVGSGTTMTVTLPAVADPVA